MNIDPSEFELVKKTIQKSMYVVPVLADQIADAFHKIIEMDNLEGEDPRLILRLFLDSISVVIKDLFEITLEQAMQERRADLGQKSMIEKQSIQDMFDSLTNMSEEEAKANAEIIALFPEEVQSDPFVNDFPWFKFANKEKVIKYVQQSKIEHVES